MSSALKNLLRPYYHRLRNRALQVTMLSRWTIVSWLQRFGFVADSIDIPKGFYQSTREWFARREGNHGEPTATYTEFYPAHHVHLSTPKTTGTDTGWRLQDFGEPVYPVVFVARIPYGRVYGRAGEVIVPDGRILVDISFRRTHTVFREQERHPVFHQKTLPPVQRLTGRVCVLTSQFAESNYFHWMFQVLPRLELFRRCGITIDAADTFVVNPRRFLFHTETLTRLGVPTEKIVESDDAFHARADDLFVTSSLRLSGHKSRWTCDFLRSLFLEAGDRRPLDDGERIYISRDDAPTRRLINESECVEFLRRFGFEKHVLRGLSVKEQATLFASATVVIAPHGAGLANLAFCSPGTKVIELFSPSWPQPTYWELSNCLGLDYYYSIGRSDGASVHSNPKWTPTPDYSANLDSLSKLMALAGLT